MKVTYFTLKSSNSALGQYIYKTPLGFILEKSVLMGSNYLNLNINYSVHLVVCPCFFYGDNRVMTKSLAASTEYRCHVEMYLL